MRVGVSWKCIRCRAVAYAGGMTERPARRHRRVQRPAAPGTDPAPQTGLPDAPQRAAEDTDRSWNDRGTDSNDEQLRRDVPPHW